MASKKITVTACGVSAKADPEVMDDYDLLEKLIDAGSETWEANIILARALFGRDGWEAVKDGLRDENGKLTKDRVLDFIVETGKQLNALKN